ncbi:MAG TPA: DUF61 family protein [Methanoregulaceae archaeon]|nr:DUF61 family protein [Methanoregulaceae archaeon]
MPACPFISDESVMMRWMNLEISKINKGIVTERRTLPDLIDGEGTRLVTKGGGEYLFSKNTLITLRTKLPNDLSRRLRLPVPCYFDSSVGDSCFITDDRAVEMLKHLAEISSMREMIHGRLWIGKTIIFDIMRKYPTLFQIVMI